MLVTSPLAMAIRNPKRILEYPCFMAFAFAVFIVPQAYSLDLFPGAVEVTSVTAVLATRTICW